MTKVKTKLQTQRMADIVELGCIIRRCYSPSSVHHIETGAGGRKNHSRTIPLCYYHHQGVEEGIHGNMGRRAWQEKYGTEQVLLAETERQLAEWKSTFVLGNK